MYVKSWAVGLEICVFCFYFLSFLGGGREGGPVGLVVSGSCAGDGERYVSSGIAVPKLGFGSRV